VFADLSGVPVPPRMSARFPRGTCPQLGYQALHPLNCCQLCDGSRHYFLEELTEAE
jgi:hypothetical protein